MASYGTMNQGPGRPRKQGGPWTTGENERLAFLVNRYSTKSQVHWVEIAREHGSRDAKQCRERWDNHLKPGLNRDKISDAEGAHILQWVRENGKHWAPLGRHLNRPENMVKNYFYQENKKAERDITKHRRQESRHRHRESHRRYSSSVPMSRDNSASSHQAYGRSSAEPTQNDCSSYRAAGPHYSPASYHPYYQYSSRRTSVASVMTNPPPLTPDHGSPAESPRAGPEIPYPAGQFALSPQYRQQYPQPIEMPVPSPYDLAEGAGHKRSNSASSYGSVCYNINPHSPTSLPIYTGFCDRQRQLPAPVPTPTIPERRPIQLSSPRNAEHAARNSRQDSDSRMSISNLLL